MAQDKLKNCSATHKCLTGGHSQPLGRNIKEEKLKMATTKIAA